MLLRKKSLFTTGSLARPGSAAGLIPFVTAAARYEENACSTKDEGRHSAHTQVRFLGADKGDVTTTNKACVQHLMAVANATNANSTE